MIAGILVAGMSLIVAKARVRKLFATAGAVVAVAVMTLSGCHHDLAGAGPKHAGPGQPHRPHQGLGSPPRCSS